MSRLLFAAARGARIQYRILTKWDIYHTWNPPYELSGDTDTFRIHPDDAHMQYGPISSALREAVFQPLNMVPNAGLPYLTGYFEFESYGYFEFESYEFIDFETDPEIRGTFLLILSEALADLGL